MQARARGAWRTQVTAARCAPSLAGPPLRRGRGSCGGRRGPPVAAGLGAGQARAPRPLLGQRPEKPEHPGPAAEGLTGGVRSRPRGGGGGGGLSAGPHRTPRKLASSWLPAFGGASRPQGCVPPRGRAVGRLRRREGS